MNDPKARTIFAAPFADRIVHQAICAEVGPLLENHLIAHTYACRAGKGTHAALRTASAWARAYPWVAHLDVKKYFPTIDHDILLAQLARDLECARTLELCERIVRAGAGDAVRFYFPGDDLFTPFTRGVGLPIGNLTSQHFANRYLSPVDHRAKDRLRIHAYLRYMDDMVLFGSSKEEVRAWATELEAACTRQRLRLHPWEVRPTRAGLGFLGFRILQDHTRVKRSSVLRAKKRLRVLFENAERGSSDEQRRFLSSLRSTFAHWKHADSWRLRGETLRELGLLYEDGEDDSDPAEGKGKENKE